jgi:hypothetical protein
VRIGSAAFDGVAAIAAASVPMTAAGAPSLIAIERVERLCMRTPLVSCSHADTDVKSCQQKWLV